MKLPSTTLLGGLAACLLALPLMAGPVTYTYTGNNFEVVNGSYTTSDFISGFFTLASALPDSDTYPDAVTPLTYSFTDGVQTFASTDPPTNVTFDLGTDPNGVPNEWDITLGTGPPQDDSIATFSEGSDSGQLDNFNEFGETIGNPGTWAVSGGQSSGAPEPGNLGLAGLGLAAIALVQRKWHRRIPV